MHVAGDVLKLEAWGLGVAMSEASLPSSSCGFSARVIGDSAPGRVNDVCLSESSFFQSGHPRPPAAQRVFDCLGPSLPPLLLG